MVEEKSLEELLEILPAQISTLQFNSSGKAKQGNVFDLVILGYRSNVEYVLLDHKYGKILYGYKLVSFYDGSIKDNVKKMIEWLESSVYTRYG